MLRLTLRNLIARKVRLLLSAFAIVLGVGFVSGSFVFTDTMGSSFDKIAYGTVLDVNVRPTQSDANPLVLALSPDDRTISTKVLKEIKNIDGVESAHGIVQGFGLFLITKDNRLYGDTGAPTIGMNTSNSKNMAGEPMVDWVQGRAPEKPGEIALDERSAKRAGYDVGETVKFIGGTSTEMQKAKLTGLLKFRSGGLAGATLMVFDTEAAQDLFLEGKNDFTGIGIEAKPGVDNDALAAKVRTVLPDDVEALTGDQLAEETKSLFDRMLGFLNNFLLVFAGIALVVGSFLIMNTFSMLVAQRSGELALLRAIGASRSQVRTSVLIEAFVVGLVGAAIGLLFGFGLAAGLKEILGLIGVDLSGSALVFAPRTVVVALLVGVVVTMVAAYLPARRASAVPPIAAMRDDQAMSEGSIRWRVIFGVAIGLIGLALMVVAVWGDLPKRGWTVGAGIIAVLLAVIATSVVTSIPVIAALGKFFQLVFGFVGRLAAQNARRNLRRTAATASALMIGLALVTSIAILGASVNASIDEGVDEQFTSDFIVQNPMRQPFSPKLADEITELPGVDRVAAFQGIAATYNDSPVIAMAVDQADVESMFDIKYLSGKAPTGENSIGFSESMAESLNLKVGQKMELAFLSGPREVSVSGIYNDNHVVPYALVPFALVDAVGIKRADTTLAVKKEDAAGFETVRRALERVTADNPALVVQDKASFAQAQRDQVDTLLNLIYALLGLAIVIAILGIVNTLALSVIERTRELGLLRAVGLERGQLRRMVRLESITIAVLGALVGILAGVLFGAALQRTFADDGISAFAIPVAKLAIFLGVAAVVGIIAAVLPAHRAAKLDVLDAISVE